MRDSGSDGRLTVWEVYQYFYCPRKLYFIRKLGLYPAQPKKVTFGGEEHERERERARRRKEIYGLLKEEIQEVLEDVSLENEELVGKADTVLKLKNGELVPVEIKDSDLGFVSRAWRKQLVAYSVLLEKKFETRIRHAILCLLPSKKVFKIEIGEAEKRELLRDLERMRRVVRGDDLPPPTSSEKCGYCEVAKFCKRI
jgi:CRISPR-associated exonuclease Cas4